MGYVWVSCRGISGSSSSLRPVCLSVGEMRHPLRPYKANLSGQEPIPTPAQGNKLGGPWAGLSAISGELLRFWVQRGSHRKTGDVVVQAEMRLPDLG